VRPTQLVLTNDAGDAEEALLGVAGWLADRTRGSTRVAHLFNPPPVGELENVRRLAPTDHGGPVTEVCARLVRAARTLAERTGLPVAPDLLIGPPDRTLSEYVRVNEFDLVTAAAGGTWLSLWGRGAWYRIARQRPVVVVGPGVSRSWAARPSGGVLALLDGTAEAEAVLGPAAALGRMLGERLTLLRVRPPDGAEPTVRSRRYLLEAARKVRADGPSVRTIVATGNPVDIVLGLQRATNAIVALAAPARSRLAAVTPGRFAMRVIRESTAPVLFYRPTP
jgi:nucleotide-binding universal stress UspA family protein